MRNTPSSSTLRTWWCSQLRTDTWWLVLSQRKPSTLETKLLNKENLLKISTLSYREWLQKFRASNSTQGSFPRSPNVQITLKYNIWGCEQSLTQKSTLFYLISYLSHIYIKNVWYCAHMSHAQSLPNKSPQSILCHLISCSVNIQLSCCICSGQVRVSCNLHKLEQSLETYKHSKKTYQELLQSNSKPKRSIKSANRNKETTGSQDICLLSAYDVVGKDLSVSSHRYSWYILSEDVEDHFSDYFGVNKQCYLTRLN